ncbi:pilus assembly protein PilM [Candidatus Saccharibacteria bacterium]|nr:MAG: pilus assembly protein PilM [Candidatus Saccharibacteria bacterium]
MSKFFYKDKPIIGLDISLTSLKLMSIDTRKWSVLGYASVDVDPNKLQTSLSSDGRYLTEMLIELRKNIAGNLVSDHVVMGIPTIKTFARSIELPHDIKGMLKDAVELEAEQYIPVPVSQLYIDYEVTGKTDTSISIMMCAVPQKLIDTCVSAASSADFQVTMIEPGMNAAARLLKVTENGDLPTVIVDIGAAATDVAVLDGAIKVTGGVPVGGNTFTIDISKKLKVPLETAHQLKVLNGLNVSPRQTKIREALEPNLKKISDEIKKIIRYYNERLTDGKKIEQVLIVGGGSNVPGIGDYFTDSIIIAARVASPWQALHFDKLQQPARQFLSRYITVAGLASVNYKEIWK